MNRGRSPRGPTGAPEDRVELLDPVFEKLVADGTLRHHCLVVPQSGVGHRGQIFERVIGQANGLKVDKAALA